MAMASHSVTALLGKLRQHVANWYVVAPLLQLVFPSRLLPHRGLYRTRLGQWAITVKMRNGLKVVSPLSQLGVVFETFVLPTYQPLGLDLASAERIADVGANIGWATLWFATKAPRARIVAVEPDRRWWPIFERNMRVNGLAARVQLVKGAIGAASGMGTVSIDRHSDLLHLTDEGDAQVPVYSLADVVGPGVDLLKLDCEGAEYAVLETASDTDLRRARTVVAEYHPLAGHSAQQLVARLRQAGFVVTSSGHPFGLLHATRSA